MAKESVLARAIKGPFSTASMKSCHRPDPRSDTNDLNQEHIAKADAGK